MNIARKFEINEPSFPTFPPSPFFLFFIFVESLSSVLARCEDESCDETRKGKFPDLSVIPRFFLEQVVSKRIFHNSICRFIPSEIKPGFLEFEKYFFSDGSAFCGSL